MRHFTCTGALCLAVWLAPLTAAHADSAKPESAPKMDFVAKATPDNYVKIDGFVTDWDVVKTHETRALTRGEPEYDWTGPKDLSLLIQLQYDSKNLYMAIEVRDNIVSGPKRRDRGDRVEVWFDSGPGGGGKLGRLRMLELALGEMPSDGKPAVSWQYPKALKDKVPTGLEKDGSLRHTGYFFEIAIPLTELSDPAPGLEPIGVGFIARDLDRDDPNEDEAAVASAPFDARKARNPDTLGRLSLEGASTHGDDFFKRVPEARTMKTIAKHWADAGGDSRRERIMLVGQYLVIVGYGLGDGDFYYYTMSHSPQHTFFDLQVRDLTGEGGAEMLVKYRIEQPGGVVQTMMAIYHFDLDRIKLIFHHEIANKGPGWEIKNEVSFKPLGKNKPTRITVTRPKTATGSVSTDNYPDVDKDLIVDWERMLLPWGDRKKNVFEWDAGQFIRVVD